MQIELTPFKDWLTCQYPHSSARKHTMSDLALFCSWAEKPPSAISPHDVDLYIQHCLSKGLSPVPATYFIRPYLSGKKGLSCCFTLIS
jgi:hypothetical protein